MIVSIRFCFRHDCHRAVSGARVEGRLDNGKVCGERVRRAGDLQWEGRLGKAGYGGFERVVHEPVYSGSMA